MRRVFVSAWLVLTQVFLTSGDGLFYVGLLKYSMPSGNVCCNDTESRDNCSRSCNLLFEVQVQGLNGSNDVLKTRLSSIPLSLAEAATFQNAQNAQLTNPLSFSFVRWPGSVNVSVQVYNRIKDNNTDMEVEVDQFVFSFVRYKPGYFYIQRDVSARNINSSSNLRMILRYYCGLTKGPACFTDCVDHDENETCPLTSPTPISPEVTFTGFNTGCKQIDEQGNVSYINCTHQTPKPTKNVTQIKYLDSGPTPSPKQVNSTSDTVPDMTSTSSNATSTFTSTIATTTTSNKIRTTHGTKTDSIKSDDPRETITADPTRRTTPDKRSTKNEDKTPMKYWPAIVGGVLGGVAVIAAVGFCLYYKRQKKMRKRQEIYNVNPKVLRNFEDYAENGTSGRADVPLETEQY